jgi:hypothetical protein
VQILSTEYSDRRWQIERPIRVSTSVEKKQDVNLSLYKPIGFGTKPIEEKT